MTFLNAVLLFGALAAILPVLIHWFSRTKYDEVDWAAMAFLALDTQTVRRSRIDHWLLLFIRCGLLGLFAVVLAAPTLPSWTLPKLGPGGPRDVIVLIDLSESMGIGEPKPIDRAKAWANRLIGSLRPTDRIAVMAVRKNLSPIVPPWESDSDRAKALLDLMPEAGGASDLPSAVATAAGLFDDATRERQIVLLTDNQKHGLADDATVARWAMLTLDPAIRVGIVSFTSQRPAESSSFELVPIRANRGVAIANRELSFHTTLKRRNDASSMPSVANVEWDGRAAGTTPISPDGPIRITHRLPAGSHVLRIKVGSVSDDFAFTVLPALPILIVQADGVAGANPLQIALAPARDPSPGFLVKSIATREFTATFLTTEPTPRVLVFADVPKLTFEQNRAVENYLQAGGSVLVSPGSRFDAAAWNAMALRGGQSWLPGRIDPRTIEKPVSPNLATSTHPLMASFRDTTPGGLSSVSFSTIWKLDPTVVPNATTIGSLSTGDPLFSERPFGRGRSIVSAVSLDGRDGSNLIKLPDYVRLVHELMYFLAGSRAGDANLSPGQPFAFSPSPYEPPAGVRITKPDGVSQLLAASKWPLVVTETVLPGVYRLTTLAGRSTYFTVRGDPGEHDFTAIVDTDREQVSGVAWIQEPSELNSITSSKSSVATKSRSEVWWLLLIGVIGLMLVELVAARRIA